MALAEVPVPDPGDIFDVDLETFLSEGVTPDVLDAPPPSVGDKAQANRLLRRIRVLDHLLEEDTDLYESEVARMKEWIERRQTTYGHERKWIARSLEAFARNQGASTVDLPNGKLKLRKSSVSCQATDDVEAIPWLAKTYPDGLRVKTEVARSEVKAHFTAGPWRDGPGVDGAVTKVATLIDETSGEVVPGVVLTRSYDEQTFSMEVK